MPLTPAQEDLADRVRAALPEGAEVREVRMFGGLSFMVDGGLAVSAGKDGGLLVRVEEARYDDLVERPGAREAVMGSTSMSPGWLLVDAHGLASDDDLAFWIAESLRRPSR
ncbi:TfoX/Sxy family protein [Propioniciclava sp.]|uniref:TfoX/Sxy family protein n=1 Tax=Propioniciclava sp. TaxID=2038686 RepID=UPI00262DE7A4|nr:TfoX/Sxy family protein [Propioniciclava sp.]